VILSASVPQPATLAKQREPPDDGKRAAGGASDMPSTKMSDETEGIVT